MARINLNKWMTIMELSRRQFTSRNTVKDNFPRFVRLRNTVKWYYGMSYEIVKREMKVTGGIFSWRIITRNRGTVPGTVEQLADDNLQ